MRMKLAGCFKSLSRKSSLGREHLSTDVDHGRKGTSVAGVQDSMRTEVGQKSES